MSSSVSCPDLIRKVIDLTNDIERREERSYREFLQAAERAVSLRDTGNLDVTLSSRLKDPSTQSDGVNSSLVLMFSFYAKLQSPATQMQKASLTYDEIKLSNETLSFFETLLMLRDFKVLPKLITKDELMFLWKVENLQRIKSGEPPLRMLTFKDFIDLLAKIAVFAYNKPGLRQFVISLNGEMLTPLEQVKSLIAYMHLEDYDRIRSTVRTVGVETATLLHNRAEGEQNPRTAKYLRDDLRGKRVAEYLSRERKTARILDDGMAESSDGNVDELNDPLAYRIASSLRMNMYGLDDGQTVPTNSIDVGYLSVGKDDRVGNIMRSIEESESEYLHSATGMVLQEHVQKPNEIKSNKLPTSGLYVPRVHISASQERALVAYHPGLAKELMRYAVESTMGGLKVGKKAFLNIPYEEEVYQPSEAAFVDIGNIPQSKACSIRIQVINRGSHEVNIQISTRGFVAQDLTVIKMPSAIAPGLRQIVIVEFKPPINFVGSCHGTVTISCVSNPSNMIFQQEHSVDCPVFYKVSGVDERAPSKSNPGTLSPRCTLRSLPSLLILQRVNSVAKSTEDLSLFNRSKRSSSGNCMSNGKVLSRGDSNKQLAEKTNRHRRLSVSHSLRG